MARGETKEDLQAMLLKTIETALDKYAVPGCYGKQPSRETPNELMWKANNEERTWVENQLTWWTTEEMISNHNNNSYTTVRWMDKGRDEYNDLLLKPNQYGGQDEMTPWEYAKQMYWEQELVRSPLILIAQAHGNQLAMCARCKYHENCWRQSLLDHNRIVER